MPEVLPGTRTEYGYTLVISRGPGYSPAIQPGYSLHIAYHAEGMRVRMLIFILYFTIIYANDLK